MTNTNVPVPPRIARLDRDVRGYPVPYIVRRRSDGVPLFAVNDEEKRLLCIDRKLCPICGERLTKELWFVGGPLSAFHPHGAYYDSAMHYECMGFALKVCPYLALAAYRTPGMENIVTRIGPESEAMKIVDPTMNSKQPFAFVAVLAYGASSKDRIPSGVRVSKPLRPYHAVEFWRKGQKLEFADGLKALYAERELDRSVTDGALRLIHERMNKCRDKKS